MFVKSLFNEPQIVTKLCKTVYHNKVTYRLFAQIGVSITLYPFAPHITMIFFYHSYVRCITDIGISAKQHYIPAFTVRKSLVSVGYGCIVINVLCHFLLVSSNKDFLLQ